MTLTVADAQLRECEIPDNRHWGGAARITGTLLRSRVGARSELTKLVQAPAIRRASTTGDATGSGEVTSADPRIRPPPKHQRWDATETGRAIAKVAESSSVATGRPPPAREGSVADCAGIVTAAINCGESVPTAHHGWGEWPRSCRAVADLVELVVAPTVRPSSLRYHGLGKHHLSPSSGPIGQGGPHANGNERPAELHLHRGDARGVGCHEVTGDLRGRRNRVAIPPDVPLDHGTCLRAPIVSQHPHAERFRKDREHRIRLSVTARHVDRAERNGLWWQRTHPRPRWGEPGRDALHPGPIGQDGGDSE